MNLLPRHYYVNGSTFHDAMSRFKKNKSNSFDLDDCFGFNDSDVDFSLLEKSSMMSTTPGPVVFQPNKPFRLALYVRPIEQRRLQRTKAALLVKNTNNKSETVNISHLSEKKENKKTTKDNRKLNVMLFDENVKPENALKKGKKTPEKIKKNVSFEVSSTRKNVLREVNTKSLTKTKQSKIRRSYERKVKEKDESENISEPPSEEILKEMDFKKLSRTKQKKSAKEDQEFEKWASNMNSAFDDVDKFELSFAYD